MSDDNLARVSHGEFIVKASAASKNRAMLEAINAGKVPNFTKSAMSNVATLRNHFAPNMNVSVTGQKQGDTLAQQIAGHVSKTLEASRPDTFRRSDGQKYASLGQNIGRAGHRNA